ncbi:MAG: DUF3048 domain-containing protein [Candidatus Promineifilaceae bacterium]
MNDLQKGHLRLFSRLCLFAVVFLLAACGGEPAPAPTNTPPPVVNITDATPTVFTDGTAVPTLPSPVVASTDVPATVSAAEPASTVTPLPTATQPIPGMIGPDNFPANVNPLTGLVVSDPAVLQRRPIAIKISNIARVRPQSGVNDADLVFEHMTEGSITRFTAVFYANDSEKVGSIRSGRLIDLEIPVMYDAAFAYSGSSGPVRLMFKASSFFDRIVSPDFGHGGFTRISDPNNPNEFFEDTLFTNTSTLRFILNERGQDVPPIFQNGMAFHPDPPAGGTPASSIEITYPATDAFWQYEPSTGRYKRWSDGVPHLDANTGAQLSFKNIIVLGANHQNTDIIEDTLGSPSIQIQIWGEGPVSIFRDGQRFEGRWRREDSGDMLTFYDLEGNLLPLSPGNSFFQLVPLGFTNLFVTE